MSKCNWDGKGWNDIYSHICALPECNGKDCQDVKAVWNETAFETLESLEDMLEKGEFNVDEKGKSDIKKHTEKAIGKKTTPLIFAIYQRKSYIVELFIKNNVDVNLDDDSGMTPLIACVEYNYPECIQLLLENGANVNAKDKEGKTALMRAAETGATDCFDILLPKSDITVQDNEGNTVKNLISKDCETCFDKLAQSICSKISIVKKPNRISQTAAEILRRFREKREQKKALSQAIQSDSVSEKERVANEEREQLAYKKKLDYEQEQEAKKEREYKLNAGSKKRKYKLHKKKTSKKTRSLKKKQTKKRRSFKKKKINLHVINRKQLFMKIISNL